MTFRSRLTGALPLVALLNAAHAADAPPAFTINCSACHLLDQAIVGPSLIEIAGIYKDKPGDFVKWCVEPGKKRNNTIQMPSMAHVPKEDLDSIHNYIQSATAGLTEKKTSNGDPYADTPHTTRRPRIQRTFLPDTGPASLYVAMPGEAKLNLVWDTDQCRLRYITAGEHDDWPYLRGNGNELTKAGQTFYTEPAAPFSSKAPSTKPVFKGYKVNNDGLPTFLYQVGTLEVAETIAGSNNTITRHFVITGNPNLLVIPKSGSAGTGPSQTVSREGNNTLLTITHARKN